MQTDQMDTMHACYGDSCDCVSEDVMDAVLDSLTRIPEAADHLHARDARAIDLAPRMAAEGWRFCPCFPMLRTGQHEWIFSLVHTNLANRLAHKAALEMAA
jgi:hypothetical protein